MPLKITVPPQLFESTIYVCLPENETNETNGDDQVEKYQKMLLLITTHKQQRHNKRRITIEEGVTRNYQQ